MNRFLQLTVTMALTGSLSACSTDMAKTVSFAQTIGGPVNTETTSAPFQGSNSPPAGVSPITINVPGSLAAQALPGFTNLRIQSYADNSDLLFDRVDGALDYRIYTLPTEAEIATAPDRSLSVRNAVQRGPARRQVAG